AERARNAQPDARAAAGHDRGLSIENSSGKHGQPVYRVMYDASRPDFLMDYTFSGFFDSLPEGAFIGTLAPGGTTTLAANSHVRLMFGWAATTPGADVRT